MSNKNDKEILESKFDLKKFVDKKYGVANINATHHYEDADGYQVDSTAPIADAITNFKKAAVLGFPFTLCSHWKRY